MHTVTTDQVPGGNVSLSGGPLRKSGHNSSIVIVAVGQHGAEGGGAGSTRQMRGQAVGWGRGEAGPHGLRERLEIAFKRVHIM